MARSWTPLIAGALVGVMAACGDTPTAPDVVSPPVRSILLHFANSGENRVWNTDQTQVGALAGGASGLVPIGSEPGERLVAFIDGTAVVLASLDTPGELDTIIQPAPTSYTLASFSQAGDLVAIAAYAPVPSLLVFDRVNRRLDTLSLGGADPVLPPVFSPDGARLVLFSLTDLSLLATIVPRTGTGTVQTVRLRFSRFLNRPVFGWPRWIGTGIRMAFIRRVDDGPDTLVVGTVFPDDPDVLMEEAYRTLLVPSDSSARELEFGDASTFALTSDGAGIVLGLIPVGGRSGHAIYQAASGVPRAIPIVDSIGQFPVFPLFIRE